MDKKIKDISRLLKLSKTISQLKNLQKLNNETIGILEQDLKEKKCASVGLKRKCESNLSKCKSYKNIIKFKIQNLSSTGGGGGAGAAASTSTLPNIRWEETGSAFQSRLQTGCITNLTHIDPHKFLSDSVQMLKVKIEQLLKKFIGLKFNLVFCCEFILPTTEEIEYKYFNTRNRQVTKSSNITSILEDSIAEIIIQVIKFVSNVVQILPPLASLITITWMGRRCIYVCNVFCYSYKSLKSEDLAGQSFPSSIWQWDSTNGNH